MNKIIQTYSIQCDVELQVEATTEEEAKEKVGQILMDLEHYEETFYGGEIYATKVIEK